MSKFKGIFDQGENQESEAPEPTAATLEGSLRMTVVPPQTPGRVGGKRSDPEYTQVSAYVGRETYRKVKVALVTDDERDFSEIVDELLRGWLAARRGL